MVALDRQDPGIGRVKAISALKGMRIVDESGALLGHVADIRVQVRKARDGAMTPHAGSLVYGSAGFLVRLGLRQLDAKVIGWDAVVRIDGKRVVVRTARGRGTRKARGAPRR